jgi:hypothetical protein
MKKITFKKDSLNINSTAPNGYKFVGYYGSTFSEQVGSNIIPIDGSADTLSAVLSAGNKLGDNYMDFTGQSKIISGKTSSYAKLLKGYYPLEEVHGPLGNTLSFTEERTIITHNFEGELKYDQSKYNGFLGGATPSGTIGAHVIDNFTHNNQHLMSIEYGGTFTNSVADSFFSIKMFDDEIFGISLNSNNPNVPIFNIKCPTFSSNEAAVAGGLTHSNIYVDSSGNLKSVI